MALDAGPPGLRPWYPTMRLFRQRTKGGWDGVFAEIGKAVEALAGRSNGGAAADCRRPSASCSTRSPSSKSRRSAFPTRGSARTWSASWRCCEGSRRGRGLSGAGLDRLTAELKQTNAALWDIEDAIRRCERQGEFGPAFHRACPQRL